MCFLYIYRTTSVVTKGRDNLYLNKIGKARLGRVPGKNIRHMLDRDKSRIVGQPRQERAVTDAQGSRVSSYLIPSSLGMSGHPRVSD